MHDGSRLREIDDPVAWDNFVAAHPQGGFLQSWRWGVFKSGYGWQPVRFGVEQGGAICAGLQMLVRTRRIARMLPGVGIAYVPRGPLATSSEQTTSLLLAASEKARRVGASFLRFEPPALAPIDLVAKGFRRAPRYVQIPRTAIVDISCDEATILGSFKPKMRYNIRLANRRGVRIDQATSEADLDDFYHLMRITAQRDRFVIHARDYYYDLWRAFDPDNGVLLIARLDREPVAALLSVAFGRSAVYLSGASSNRHREHMAPHALQWEAMRWAKHRGCSKYDLWGAAVSTGPQDPMAGVHRFKLGFNPEIVEYPGAFDQPIHRVRTWALTRGLLLGREVLNQWRNSPIGTLLQV